MKTKVIAVSIAGILSAESMALASSRVDVVGDKQIAEAVKEISDLKTNLQSLHKSLGQAEQQLLQSQTEGNTARGISLANAAIATGLSLIIYNKLAVFRGVTAGLGISAAIATGISAVASAISDVQKKDVDLTSTEKELTTLRSQVAAQIAADKDENKELQSLSDSLTNLDKALQIYKTEDSEENVLHLKSIATQSVGLSILAISMISPKSTVGMSAAYFGSLVLIVGNSIPFLDLATSDQKTELLNRITALRSSIEDTIEKF